MGPADQQKERLTDIASKVLESMRKKDGFPETPTLKKDFRCPYDGSTNVQKIKAILEADIHSFTRDGKTTPTTSNSVLLMRYRPGNKPMRPYFLLIVGPSLIFFGFVMAGMMGRGFAAWIPFLLMTLLGSGAIWAFVHSCQHIDDECVAWAKKVYIADHHWHCHQCGGHFEPGRPGSNCAMEPQGGVLQMPQEEPGTAEGMEGEQEETAPNVSPFKPD